MIDVVLIFFTKCAVTDCIDKQAIKSTFYFVFCYFKTISGGPCAKSELFDPDSP